MMRFEYRSIGDWSEPEPDESVEVMTNATTLEAVCEQFERFLLAAGFPLGSAHIGLVEDEITDGDVKADEWNRMSAADQELVEGCLCQRCGQRYKMDLMVPDSVWLDLTGRSDGGGLWCPTCIVQEMERRLGYSAFGLLDLIDDDALDKYGGDPEPEDCGNDWIPWSGGECPVDGSTMVDVQLLSGSNYFGLAAGTWRWCYFDRDDDIVAYRLHTPAMQSPPDRQPDAGAYNPPQPGASVGNSITPEQAVEALNDAPWIGPHTRVLAAAVRLLSRKVNNATIGIDTSDLTTVERIAHAVMETNTSINPTDEG